MATITKEELSNYINSQIAGIVEEIKVQKEENTYTSVDKLYWAGSIATLKSLACFFNLEKEYDYADVEFEKIINEMQ